MFILANLEVITIQFLIDVNVEIILNCIERWFLGKEESNLKAVNFYGILRSFEIKKDFEERGYESTFYDFVENVPFEKT